MIVVTGGAGFIGSCIVKELNKIGIKDILIVDKLGNDDKWKNMIGMDIGDYIDKDNFIKWLNDEKNDIYTKEIDVIIHMGACSSTRENNMDYLMENNFNYSKQIWRWCVKNNKRIIYASSAATYGMGENGFADDISIMYKLRPLNGYAFSKQCFDLWVNRQESKPKQYVGLKFFNVYGPNEYHKNDMVSMVYKGFYQIEKEGSIKLFKGRNEENGEYRRDFVYIKDILKVVLYFMKNKNVNGIFNVGTGEARSFDELAQIIFSVVNKPIKIDHISMPEFFENKYQNYTKADLYNLREAGYKERFYTLEEGISEYILKYLRRDSNNYY